MSCIKEDLCNNLDKCYLCINENYFKEKKVKKTYSYKKNRADKRTGSIFEYNNHKNNENMIKVASNMTPNSGAGKIKGDEQISGIINIMEELKTKVKIQAKGKETFTIHKKWLDKLKKESAEANQEFWVTKLLQQI